MQQTQDPAARLAATLAHLRRGYVAEPYPTAATRRDRLSRAIDLLSRHKRPFCQALEADFGSRPHTQSLIADIFTTIEALKHARAHVRRWMRPERRSLRFPLGLLGARAEVFHQPAGVVGVIGPWNFPLNLLLGPLAGILAAGNRAFLKPSEHTPRTASLLAELLPAFFADDEVAIATGGQEVGAAFSHLPFDHLIYTGGASVAKAIMRAAADNLVPVTLELGGKSPVLVGRSADLATAALRIIGGKMLNMGQVCLAPDYVLVPEAGKQTFIDAALAAARRLSPGTDRNPDVAAVINQAHFDRLTRYLDDARQRGARVMAANAGDAGTRLMPITLVIDPPDDSLIMREEIFGPLLVVRTYQRFDDAIARIRAGDRPLALYYFGHDRGEVERLRRETHSGALALNDVIMQYTVENLPFGGTGASGMGAYHGHDGFKTFSVRRAIYRQTWIDSSAIVRPPFTRLKTRLFDFLTGP